MTIESIKMEAPCGRLSGTARDGILSFKGIPFAKPPLGPLRWRAPEPLEPWAGERDATKFGAICPQAPTALENLMGSAMAEQSEDCLTLNVWTPGLEGQKKPVMVWFHGGAFVIGAGSQGIYNGKHLAARGVVVVTANYRLGAFGFLNLSDATDGRLPGTGSEGLLDQIAALRWVRDNIASFGGDPSNVTIFGESAGGMSVACLMASPVAKGLFHKAIPQSGAGHIGYSRDRSARVARALLEEMRIPLSEAERAQAAPHAAIVKGQIAVLMDARDGDDTRHLGRMPFQPAIDGTVLAERPIQTLREGAAAGIPVLTGTTRDEWKLFTAADPRARLMFEKGIEKRVIAGMGDDFGRTILGCYAEGSPFERWNQIMTDRVFTIPALRLAQAQGAHAPVYAYRFDWTSPLLGGIFGACHALELGFMWGTHGAKTANKFFGEGPEAERLAALMMNAWVQFARTGTPGNNWPSYDAARHVMRFDREGAGLETAPNENRRRVWDTAPDKMLGS